MTRVEPTRRLVVISGPGGAGKGTIVRRLLELDPTLVLSRSWTTRARRPGEDADAYVFVSRDEFEAHVAREGFLEWAEFLGNYYGTPDPRVDPERSAPEVAEWMAAAAGDEPLSPLILEIDVQGARQIRQRDADALCVFIDAPSTVELESRLRGRGDDDSHVTKRLRKAQDEADAAQELGAVVVVNHTVDQAAGEVLQLIRQWAT